MSHSLKNKLLVNNDVAKIYNHDLGIFYSNLPLVVALVSRMQWARSIDYFKVDMEHKLLHVEP